MILKRPPPTNEASLGIINEDTASSSTQDEPAPIATEQTPTQIGYEPANNHVSEVFDENQETNEASAPTNNEPAMATPPDGTGSEAEKNIQVIDDDQAVRTLQQEDSSTAGHSTSNGYASSSLKDILTKNVAKLTKPLGKHRKPILIGAAILIALIIIFSVVSCVAPKSLDASSNMFGYKVEHPDSWSTRNSGSGLPTMRLDTTSSNIKIVAGTVPYEGATPALTSSSDYKSAFAEGVEELQGAYLLPGVKINASDTTKWASVKLGSQDCVTASGSSDQGSYVAYGTVFGDIFSTIVFYTPDSLSPGLKATIQNMVDSLSIDAPTHTATFEAEGKTVEKKIVWDLGQGASVKVPEAPEVEGKAFDRWEPVKPAKVDGDYITNITGDTKITAKYTTAYEVVFLDGNGNEIKKEWVKEGGAATAPEPPAMDHYKFIKWDTSLTNVKSNLTIKPVYEPVWTVTFTDGNGGVFATVEVDNGQSASVKGNPTKDGYTFEGWSVSTANVTSNLTVDPVFKRIPTKGEKNALGTALSYLKTMPFSYTGLIKQLEYEKYSHEEAVYAADNCGADWNEQAVKQAKSYLSFMSFSRGGLIDQLIYEGFTPEQATYGADKMGL